MNMLKKITLIMFACALYSQSMLAMSEKALEKWKKVEQAKREAAATARKQTVLSFDIDDVISGKAKIGISDYLTLVLRMMLWNPMVVTALFPANQAAMSQYVTEIQKTVNGGSNVVHEIIGYLKNNGYGDLSCYEPEIIERSQKPYPVTRMIDDIKKLKAAGYSVIGATNQDYMQHQAYRRYMKDVHGIDLNTLFDAVLTTCVYHAAQPAGDDLCYRLNATDNIYVARNREAYKPHSSYFTVVQELAKKVEPTSTRVIHTDDRKENIDAAEQAGIEGIHFNLPGESVRKTTPADLDNSINAWEAELKGLGIQGLAVQQNSQAAYV